MQKNLLAAIVPALCFCCFAEPEITGSGGARFSSKWLNASAVSGSTSTQSWEERLKFGVELGPPPLRAKAGHLSAGNSFSKMKNPQIVLSSLPYSGAGTASPGGTLTLPSSPAKDAPLYAGLSARWNGLWLDGYRKDDGDMAASLGKTFKFEGAKKLLVGASAGIFCREPKLKDAWFLDEQYFAEGNYASACEEVLFSSKPLKIYAGAGAAQDPLGGFLFWNRIQASLDCPCAGISGGYYRGTMNSTMEQAYLNPHVKFFVHSPCLEAPLAVRLGCYGAAYKKRTSDRHKDEFSQAKLCEGAEFSYKQVRLTFSHTAAGIGLETGDVSDSKLDARADTLKLGASVSLPKKTQASCSASRRFCGGSYCDTLKFSVFTNELFPAGASLSLGEDSVVLSCSARFSKKGLAVWGRVNFEWER